MTFELRHEAPAERSDGTALPAAPLAAVDAALRFPLFDAILSRRARRFAVGAELPGGPNAWRSAADPLPLTDAEEDLLAAAGTGLSGLQLGDWSYRDAAGQPTGGHALAAFAGRAGASPCGIQAAQLFISNDTGTWLVASRGCMPGAADEGAAGAVGGVRRQRVRVLDHRVETPRVAPVMPAFNHWDVNVAGSTVFMPVADITRGLINNLLMYLDEPHNYYIVDGNKGAEPLAGFPWLDRSRTLDLADMERGVFTDLAGVEPALMGENIYLAIQALGLGGWLFSAPRAAVLFDALGFRFDGSRPLGLDGLFEPLVAPYMATPEEAVRSVYEEKWGAGGTFAGGAQPFRPEVALDHAVPRTSERAIAAATALYRYCIEAYGRFPATVPCVAPGVWVQAHHLEIPFYDRYYGGSAVPDVVRGHMALWHSAEHVEAR